ncbi:MAG: ribose 5-phosphate isomerase B [Clostridia bacterium]
MRISIGADHGAFELKKSILKYLDEKNYEVQDFGCYSADSVDYPEIGANVARSVAEGNADFGIVLCTTGIGISISANKIRGVRAALCTDTHLAKMTRLHNNANVLAMGAYSVSGNLANEIVETFLSTEFEGGRHQRRVDLITAIEEGDL